MHIAVYLTLLLPLAGIPALAGLGPRLPPRAAGGLLAAGVLVFAGTSTGAVALLATAGLARVPAVARWGDLSRPVLLAATAVPLPVGVAAAACLTAAATAAGVSACRWLRALAVARRLVSTAPGELVVIDSDTATAFAVPGRPGRIVVSTGMLGALTARQRAALLAHERAHLAGRHNLALGLTRIASAAYPLAWPLRRALSLSIERCADESAASDVGSRNTVAHAIGKAALADHHRTQSCSPLASAAAGPVPRRVAALLHGQPPTYRPLLVKPALLGAALLSAGLLLVTTGCSLDAATDLHGALDVDAPAVSVSAPGHPSVRAEDTAPPPVRANPGGARQPGAGTAGSPGGSPPARTGQHVQPGDALARCPTRTPTATLEPAD
jgi:Zn-dependent protease with chaperone function